MNNIIIDKTYTVELLIQGGQTTQQVYFPILQVLDRKVTQSIGTNLVEILTKSPQNQVLANTPLIQCSYLNLVVGDVQQIWNIPLVSLITVTDGTTIANPFLVELNNLPIIWAKSYVFIADITTIALTNEVFVFDIHYADPTPNDVAKWQAKGITF